ncbi:MAG: 4Fe-4S binding protein [Desulfurococcales archaeon]|nr:4Fe-4S binding protein [Desulfurococcales archaeon]
MAEEKLPAWNELPPGAVILEPGSSEKRYTGDWRIFRPVLNQDKCIRCLLCWVYCPDDAFYFEDEPYVTNKGRKYKFSLKINYDHCKGCGICVEECPVNAIDFVEEVK